MSVTLTYAELAVRIGRSEPAAKSLAKRKRWRRSVGNDGLSRITLDQAELDELADPDRHGIGRPPANSTRAHQAEPSSNPVQSMIADLQAKLAVAEALAMERKEALDFERERANSLGTELVAIRELAAAVDPLKATIEALERALNVEQDRLTEVRMDRDRWHETATRITDPISQRPWWKRLAG